MRNMRRSPAVVMGMVLSMIISLSLFAGGRAVFAAPAIPAVTSELTSLDAAQTIGNNETIKLSDVNVDGTIAGPIISVQNGATANLIINGTTLKNINGPIIRIQDSSTLNLYIEGTNDLSVLSTCNNACIEVENGSTLNIYGVDGGSLTVKGGKWGAGIGSAGTNNHTVNIPGDINIISGTITAYGGIDGGAGIGSGRGSSAGKINITGGTVTAYGRGHGAGIGSGYCTSGGSIGSGHQSGSFTGGNITITGGTVKAASGEVNFSVINDEPSSYNQNKTHGAGIGGGYGSTSGTIVIGGYANVFAVGQCGGAGIGAGRGTSDSNEFDKNCIPFDITIGGNAVVKAYAGMDSRNDNSGARLASGAGIGGGRGVGTTEEDKGRIVIKDNVKISANAGAVAQAIGYSIAAEVTIKTDTVVSDVTPRPKTAEIETQCVKRITASVGGQAVQNALSQFTTVTPSLAERLRTLAAATPVSATVTAPASWTKDSGDYTFRIETDNTIKYDDFRGLFVDNNRELVEDTDFTKREGSVIIVVKSSALKSLSSGNHTFSALFGTDKKVNLSFTLKNATYNYDDDDYDDDDDDYSSVPATVTVADEKKKAPKTGER